MAVGRMGDGFRQNREGWHVCFRFLMGLAKYMKIDNADTEAWQETSRSVNETVFQKMLNEKNYKEEPWLFIFQLKNFCFITCLAIQEGMYVI